MTGYELPLRAIREQIASAVDLIVHTARLKDGTRKVVNITEVYGIEDDEILTQDIFAFEQTGVEDGKIEGELKPTGIRPTFMGQFERARRRAAAGRVRDPAGGPGEARPAPLKGRWGVERRSDGRSTASVPASARAVRSGRRDGLRLVDRAGRPGDRPRRQRRRSRSRRASAWPTSRRSSRRPAARSTRSSGRTGRCGPDRLRRRSTRSGCAGSRATAPIGQGDAACRRSSAGPVPGLDRGHRRGLAARRRPRLSGLFVQAAVASASLAGLLTGRSGSAPSSTTQQ